MGRAVTSQLSRENDGLILLPGIDLNAIVDAVADRVAAKLQSVIQQTATGNEPLLLTIEQASRIIGRSVAATEHLVREGTLPVVRIDRRIYIDYRDILDLIDRSKQPFGALKDKA
jgi:hypothetical protein